MTELSKTYEPKTAENKWYGIWEEKGLFTPEQSGDSTADPFAIVIPPPNVTGNLHIGHALNHTLQDVLTRFARKKGKRTLWLPGMDHAGIATQNVVERKLQSEGKTRFDLGREEFVKHVWDWKKQYGGQIKNQQRKLGESVDWGRERFTLDDGLSEAVKEVFISLYKKGKIYRGHRIINWSPKGYTALSDIEVIFKEKQGKMYHLRYPLADGDGHVIVATTRPETMLGDMAVAAHPDDERYKKFAGKKLKLPLTNREIPIIFDDYVDQEFGSGLVKITPAHDFNDYEVGLRHDLEPLLIMDEHAHINENGGAYQGLYRYKARKKIIADLEEQDLIEKIEDHKQMVGHCYRTDDEVEPILSQQWFVDVGDMAKRAIEAVESGQTRFVPAQWEKTYFQWMYNIKDWCISRQLWWGHRIPAYYCQSCGETVVAKDAPKQCPKCNAEKFEQDSDVLDTWFSSGLWPFSTLGWPHNTEDLKTFYPTTVLVTGFDIIFFWVARMMMFGLEFMDEVPFKDVLIHGLVRDQDGAKFSKSKGNTVDPLDLMEEYGTDAFRFFLLATMPEGKDIIFNVNRLKGYQGFCNKIWNSTRFIFQNLPADYSIQKAHLALQSAADDGRLKPADLWILSSLDKCIEESERALSTYRFQDYSNRIYDFFWKEFCDWYIELVKSRVFGHQGEEDKATANAVLVYTLHSALQILHPAMPFITEEIGEKLGADFAITSAWPQPWLSQASAPIKTAGAQAAQAVELAQELVSAVRNIRGELNIPPGNKVELIISGASESCSALFAEAGYNLGAEISNLAKLESYTLSKDYEPQATDGTAPFSAGSLYVPMSTLDLEKEIKKRSGVLDNAKQALERIQKKLSNDNFLQKAASEVVEKEKAKEQDLVEKVKQAEAALAQLQK